MTEHNEATAWQVQIDADARAALDKMGTIAVIGLSPRPERDSHRVSAYMQQHGYRIIPVNPAAVGTEILGETVYAALEDIPHEFDTVTSSAARTRPTSRSMRPSPPARRECARSGSNSASSTRTVSAAPEPPVCARLRIAV